MSHIPGLYMETYRSGHNGADSKSVCGQPHVGSNPTVSAKKEDMTCWSCLPFWVSWAAGPLHPSVIQMLGGSEFRLRRGFACGKTLVRRISAAGQKADCVVLLYLFESSKYRF